MLPLSLLFLTTVYAFPEMFLGCQPQIDDRIMTSYVQDDKTWNKCNITLWDTVAQTETTNITLNGTYQIRIRPNFGGEQIHMLISASSGALSQQPGGAYGVKDYCDEGMVGVIWSGLTDMQGVTYVNFNWRPTGSDDVKFAVTCTTDFGQAIFQHQLFTGTYQPPKEDIIKGSVGLAVVVALMVFIPIGAVVLYCVWFKVKPMLAGGSAPSTSRKEETKDEEDEEEEEEKPKPKKKSKRKDKFEKLDDEEDQ